MEKRLKGHDVLELKTKLAERIVTTPWFRYMQNFIEDISRKNSGSYFRVSLTEVATGEVIGDVFTSGEAWCLAEYQAILMSEAYLIASQMNPLIRLAAADVPDDLTFERHMVPSSNGFLVFEDPWETIDVSGRSLLTRVVVWQVMEDQFGTQGIQVSEYTAMSDNDDISQILKERSPNEAKNMVALLGDLQIQHLMPMRFGTSLAVGVDPDWSDVQKNAAVGPVKAIIALWLLMQQRITETVVPSMSPRSERRWERKRVKPAVNVINLRHRRIVSETASQHESGGGREWSGRWMVRGHWRNQPFGPGRQERHWLYIHPYLKGPDDKPIIDKRPKVYKLSR